MKELFQSRHFVCSYLLLGWQTSDRRFLPLFFVPLCIKLTRSLGKWPLESTRRMTRSLPVSWLTRPSILPSVLFFERHWEQAGRSLELIPRWDPRCTVWSTLPWLSLGISRPYVWWPGCESSTYVTLRLLLNVKHSAPSDTFSVFFSLSLVRQAMYLTLPLSRSRFISPEGLLCSFLLLHAKNLHVLPRLTFLN